MKGFLKLIATLIVIAFLCFVLFSCKTYKCYPSKRDYSKIIIEQSDVLLLSGIGDAPFRDNNSYHQKNTK